MNTVREDQIGRAIVGSFIGHAAIFVFIIVKSFIFPGEPLVISPPALRVDIVGLPDLLKKDLHVIKESAPPLVKEIKETKKIEKTSPMTTEPPPKADEMILNPKKSAKKSKIDSALARIRALEKMNESDEPVVIKGNQVSAGTSLSGDAREKSEAGYFDLIRDSLIEHWALPPWLARQKLSAQIQIRIDPAGRVLSSKFIKNSGNETFDAAILGTLRDSQPLPRPPKELLNSLSDDGIVVGFPL